MTFWLGQVTISRRLFKLSRIMLDDEEFPMVFDNTTLHQIYKGKGNRYIHSKEWFPRLVKGMVVEEMKPVILKGSSPYQIGGSLVINPKSIYSP